MAFEKNLPTIEEEINRFEMMAEICISNSSLHGRFKQHSNFLRELVKLRCSYGAVKAALEETIRQKRELEEICMALKKNDQQPEEQP